MRHSIRAAAGLMGGLVAAVLSVGAAGAADLDYGMKDGYRPRAEEPYAPYYYHRDEPPPPPRRYSEPPPPYDPPPYSERERRYSNYDERHRPDPRDASRYDQRGCLTKGEIHYRLKEHGWQDFHELELRSDVAVVNARRPDGMLYRLSVDRCSGVIVSARLVDEGRGWRQGYRPYSYSY